MDRIQGETPLVVKMRDMQVWIWFGVVPKLAVTVSLQTKFIDKCIQEIFPIHQKIIPDHLAPAAILGLDTAAKVTSISSHKAGMDKHDKHATSRVAKLIITSPQMESPFACVTS